MPTSPLIRGQYYHIYNRGNNRENLFLEERNYRHFLKLYAKYIFPIADTFAYCLLPNHFHLLARIKTVDEIEKMARTDSENLSGLDLASKPPSQHFSNLFNAYTRAFNRAYRRTGALFQRPFQRILVADQAYFTQLVIYIHQNPQKHGLVDDFQQWPYSSYRALFVDKPTQLRRAEVLDWFNGEVRLKQRHQQPIDWPLPQTLQGEDFD